METQADRDAIADEAVGQKRDSPPPEARRETGNRSLEEVNRISQATGADASIPEKTAESLGERVADAYSDPDLADRPVSIGQGSARRLLSPFEVQRLLTLVTGFAPVILQRYCFIVASMPVWRKRQSRFRSRSLLKATDTLGGLSSRRSSKP